MGGYWYEVLTTRKFHPTDAMGQIVKLLIHVVDGQVVEVQEVY